MVHIYKSVYVRFGRIIYIDAIKRQMNYLHWPYSAPVVLDEEWQITPIFGMLSLSESFDSYTLALSFMFDLEPHMRMKVLLIFSDCGINK